MHETLHTELATYQEESAETSALESMAMPTHRVFVLRLWQEKASTNTVPRQRLLLESYESRVRYGFGDAAELAAFVDGILTRMAPVV